MPVPLGAFLSRWHLLPQHRQVLSENDASSLLYFTINFLAFWGTTGCVLCFHTKAVVLPIFLLQAVLWRLAQAACLQLAGMAVGPAPLEMPVAQDGSSSSREGLSWVEGSCAFKAQWCSEYLWWIWEKAPFLLVFFPPCGYWLYILYSD